MRKAEILPFRRAAAPVTPPPQLTTVMAQPAPCGPALARSALDIDLIEIAHRLGLEAYQPATIVGHLRNLASSRGFPLPRTTRFWRGDEVTGPRRIVARSRWNRYEVDRWFEDRDPPAPRAARQRAARETLRADMQERAASLAAGRIAASC